MNAPADKTVLVAPLDWGLGHAARCMPIIDCLLANGTQVHLAGNGSSLQFLTDKYPKLPTHELPGYNIQYPLGKNASVQILLQSPRMFRTIKKEHEYIQKIVAENSIQAIISDNRYGVWDKSCRNIFLCHQIALQSPPGFSWMNPFFLRAHFRMMKNFDTLWIPDRESEPNLSGKLSHGFSIPIAHRYIGTLSRFNNPGLSSSSKKYKLVALLSGNEPQRTFFEEQLKPQLRALKFDVLLVRGVTEKKEFTSEGKMDIVSYMQAEDLLPILQQTEAVVCRSGYSTLMDLAALGKKAILVPTPGQTEQEYLANRLSKKGMAVAAQQSTFNLKRSMEMLDGIKGWDTFKTDPAMLDKALENDLYSTG